MKRLTLLPALALLIACGDSNEEPSELTGPVASVVEEGPNFVDMANDLLASAGSEYRIEYAELLTADAASKNIIIANDRGNQRLGFEFIPNDPRRTGGDGDPNTIDVYIDQTDGATANGLSEAETTDAILGAMATWNSQQCSDLGIGVAPVPVDLGLVQSVFGFGGGAVTSDIMHAGWLPGAFFDLLRPNGSQSILGVTFTLTFTSGDLDGNGIPDLGAREIYYNDAFPWSTDGTLVDVESIALHEAGHGLSQGHFGKVFVKKNGTLHFSPRAVMNAVYAGGVGRDVLGTDRGGHCGLWARWWNGGPIF